MGRVRRSALLGPLTPRLEVLLSAGGHNFSIRGVTNSRAVNTATIMSTDRPIRVPPIILGDDTIISIGTDSIHPEHYGLHDAIKAEKLYDRFSKGFIAGWVGEI
jgi:hypothetical protein